VGPSCWASAIRTRRQTRLKHRGSDLSRPIARLGAHAASIDAPASLVRALRPLSLLWPSPDRWPRQREPQKDQRALAPVGAVRGVHRRRGSAPRGRAQAGLEPRGFRPLSSTPTPLKHGGSNPSPPVARRGAHAASIDAPASLVRALHPLSLLWPSPDRWPRQREPQKAQKGSSPGRRRAWRP